LTRRAVRRPKRNRFTIISSPTVSCVPRCEGCRACIERDVCDDCLQPNNSALRLKPLKVKEVIPIDMFVVADLDDTPVRVLIVIVVDVLVKQAFKNALEIAHMGIAAKYRVCAPSADAKVGVGRGGGSAYVVSWCACVLIARTHHNRSRG
jgi:hypothetical protein